MGANAPYYTNTKLDDINVIEASDLEAIETGFDDVDTDKADKIIPAVTNNLAALSATGNLADSGKAYPSGTVVGTTDTQTLTNKTLTSPTINGGTLTNVTLDNPTINNGWTEETYIESGTGEAFDVSNGTIWKYTMTSNATFTDSLSDGEVIELHLLGGDSYTFTPPSGEWVNDDTPVLTAYDIIIVKKIDSQMIYQYVGAIVL